MLATNTQSLKSFTFRSYYSPNFTTVCRARRVVRRSHCLQASPVHSMASLAPSSKKHKVTVVGSGNWGSAIAKIIAENTKNHASLFEAVVQMWVYEEEVSMPKDSKQYAQNADLAEHPQKLTTIVNRLHENVKYLPNVPLPHNLVANPSITDAVKDSTILIFNLPHQFISKVCQQLHGHILPCARGISCIKGVDVSSEGISLFCESIGQKLGIYCGALSGANIANEVALEKWCESTIAYDPPPMDSRQPTPAGSRSTSPGPPLLTEHKDSSGKPSKVKLEPLPQEYPPLSHDTMKKLFHRPYFHVRVVQDVAGVSLGGALKNVVALAAGFAEGLGWGDNAKAAIMRVGIIEQVRFGHMFFPQSFQASTLLEESCGVADMITSCSGGRNFRCARSSVRKGISIGEVEQQELNGQKLQGTSTAEDVNAFLKRKGHEADFPLLTAVYNVLQGKIKPEQIPSLIEDKGAQ